MRCRGHDLLDHAYDFFELGHQVLLRVQPSRRVEDQVVDPTRDRCRDGIERDRGRIRTCVLLDDRDP